MGSRDSPKKEFLNFFSRGREQQQQQQIKMSETEAKDAFIIFDEAYEGNDVDAFYVGDILRALGCNVTNAAVVAAGGAAELGQKRVASPTSSPSWPPSRPTPPPPESR